MPKFDPARIVDFSKDYYAILGLELGCLPTGSTRAEKKKASEILAKAYRTSARKARSYYNDDADASDQAFMLIQRAQYILEDPMLRRYYETRGEYKPVLAGENGDGFEINWDELGTYRPGTAADTHGHALFLAVCARANELGIVPAFRPTDETHNYEWDWALPEQGAKIALSIVHDGHEVLRLGGGDDEDSLPFKIYFCIPRASMYFLREPEEVYEIADLPDGEFRFSGKLRAAEYSDYSLLETTKMADALAFVSAGGYLESAIAAFRDGSLVAEQHRQDRAALQTQWLSKEEIQSRDTAVLKSILRSKTWNLTPDPSAADFLDRIVVPED
jgi:hypothetical protein